MFPREKDAVVKIRIFEAASELGSVNRAVRSPEDELSEIFSSRLPWLHR